jgi:hypothetical protein
MFKTAAFVKASSSLVLAVVLQPLHGHTLWSFKWQAKGTVPDELSYTDNLSVSAYTNIYASASAGEKTDLRTYPDAP